MLGLSADFLTEVGRIAVLQSEVEVLLGRAISNLAGMEDAAGDALAAPLGFRQLSQVSESLLKLRAAELGNYADELEELLKKAVSCEKRRNTLVHSMWGFGPGLDPAMASRVKLSGKPAVMKTETVPLAELRDLAEEMKAVVDGLTYIYPHLRPAAPQRT
jgi:hypothetical protein